jgi:hypothetical protein
MLLLLPLLLLLLLVFALTAVLLRLLQAFVLQRLKAMLTQQGVNAFQLSRFCVAYVRLKHSNR